MARCKFKCFSLFLVVMLMLSSTFKAVYGDWVTGTKIVNVWITFGALLGKGYDVRVNEKLLVDYTTKSWIVDVSKIKDAVKVYIEIWGRPTPDPYARFLIVKIDGQIVNPTLKHASGSNRQVTCTAVIQGSFKVRYPVTNMVKNKDRVKVTIHVSVGAVGYQWIIFAKFIGIVEEKIYIPPKPEPQPKEEPTSSTEESTSSSQPSEEPSSESEISPSLPPPEESGGESQTTTGNAVVYQPVLAIPLSQFSATLGLAFTVAGLYLRGRELE